LRPISDLSGLHLDGILTNGDFCLAPVNVRLDPLIGFRPGLVSGTLKIRYSLCRTYA